MTSSTCFDEIEVDSAVNLTEDEMVTLFMNMIAFEGDWDAHMKFLNGLDPAILWKYDQMPLVEAMQEKDRLHGIQAAIS